MTNIRLTMAQALVRYLCNQYTVIDGRREKLFAGVFAIFGHGNVTCLGEALEAGKNELPTWRGQNEQSMALAGIAYAKAKKRRQIMVATSSIGPGATNMLTACALAHVNRLPILIVSGDVFNNRRPDPVLQQIEDFRDPTMSVNDAFRPLSRYWDRCTHPEQIISSLPQAVATMLDPADCGPAFIGLCQDIQEIAYDYPSAFFEPCIHEIRRPRPDERSLARAVALLRQAKRPLIISGGGVRYAGAEIVVADFAKKHGIPLAETIAGKGSVSHQHPAHVGPIGVIGSSSANEMAAEADVILAIGTRLQDFSTGSWTLFSEQTQFISVNANRWDATKHRALSVIGDALVTMTEMDTLINDERLASQEWTTKGVETFARWNALLDEYQLSRNTKTPTYAEIVSVVNKWADERDVMVTAAGGLPGEVSKGWRVKAPHTFDCEFGFSCMGYEIAGGWGHAMAAEDGATPIVLVGDGSYLMMNSDIYSSVLSGHKMIVIVCDNGGFAVINRLQNFKGSPSFNNLIKDCRVKEPSFVDFIGHAKSMGAYARKVKGSSDLLIALEWAKTTDKTTVITIDVDAHTWTPGDALWDVGVPEVSERNDVMTARTAHDEIRAKQRKGI